MSSFPGRNGTCIFKSHNPYFNRWFSAITEELDATNECVTVTILILIDGFLQYVIKNVY